MLSCVPQICILTGPREEQQRDMTTTSEILLNLYQKRNQESSPDNTTKLRGVTLLPTTYLYRGRKAISEEKRKTSIYLSINPTRNIGLSSRGGQKHTNTNTAADCAVSTVLLDCCLSDQRRLPSP